MPNLPLTSVTACYIFLYLHFCSLLGFLSAVMASPYLWSIQSQNIKTKTKKRNFTLKIRSWLIFSIWILNSLESYFCHKIPINYDGVLETLVEIHIQIAWYDFSLNWETGHCQPGKVNVFWGKIYQICQWCMTSWKKIIAVLKSIPSFESTQYFFWISSNYFFNFYLWKITDIGIDIIHLWKGIPGVPVCRGGTNIL